MTFSCSSAPAIDDRPDRDPRHDDEHGQDVEHLRQPVAGVRERRHQFSADRRYSPSIVKQTMTASIQYCEAVAFFTSR